MRDEPFSSQSTYDEPRDYSEHEQYRSFSVPLNGITGGRIQFERGISNVRIATEADMPDLIRARFEGILPRIHADGGEISIRYLHYSLYDWLKSAITWERQSARLLLNSAVPWEIAVQGGLSHLQADLRNVKLRSFDVQGGASSLYVRLGSPERTTPLRIFGGASHIVVFRPAGVAARLRIHGGVSSVTLDEQHFSAIGGGTVLNSLDASTQPGRFDVEVYGGASVVTVATE